IDAEQDVPLVQTTGDVSLSAGRPTGKNDPLKTGFIGQLTIAPTGEVTVSAPFRVSGTSEAREDPTSHDIFDNDSLFVTAAGTADVSVEGGRFLRLLSATATELDAHIDVTQSGDAISMRGQDLDVDLDGTTEKVMVVTNVSSITKDVDFAVAL